jgi:hypothetical protein
MTPAFLTPFSIQQQDGREKQGAKKDSARGQEPHRDSLSPGSRDERRDGHPRCQEQQQRACSEQRDGADQTQRRNPIRLRPFAPLKIGDSQPSFYLPYAVR